MLIFILPLFLYSLSWLYVQAVRFLSSGCTLFQLGKSVVSGRVILSLILYHKISLPLYVVARYDV